jgi:hypothetical protein
MPEEAPVTMIDLPFSAKGLMSTRWVLSSTESAVTETGTVQTAGES